MYEYSLHWIGLVLSSVVIVFTASSIESHWPKRNGRKWCKVNSQFHIHTFHIHDSRVWSSGQALSPLSSSSSIVSYRTCGLFVCLSVLLHFPIRRVYYSFASCLKALNAFVSQIRFVGIAIICCISLKYKIVWFLPKNQICLLWFKKKKNEYLAWLAYVNEWFDLVKNYSLFHIFTHWGGKFN